MKKIIRISMVGLTLLFATTSQASVIYSGSSGSLAAQATFDVVGGKLVVTLTNTSANDVLVPADVLTAVFFKLNTSALTPVSALLASGSSVFFGPDGGGNLGGEWGYGSGLSQYGANMGISSSGLGGVFGAPNFTGANLQGPIALDGLQYGITSAGDNVATGNAAVTGGNALIKNSVVFTLSSLASGFDLSWISNVTFQYGTSLTEPSFGGTCTNGCGGSPPQNIPEPALPMLIGAGLLSFYLVRRRASRIQL